MTNMKIKSNPEEPQKTFFWKTRKQQNFQPISKTHVWLLRKDRLVQEKTQKHLSLIHLLTPWWYSLQFLFPGIEENKNIHITKKQTRNNGWDIKLRRAYTKIELREIVFQCYVFGL